MNAAHRKNSAGRSQRGFTLLEVMIASPGRAFQRADLLELLQGDFPDGVERTVDVHIRNLRTKIEPDAGKPFYIETVYGIGYRFRPEDQA